uniref:HMG domain-containing protein n=1 Tax=Sander lucioperca TaxID=283035 RepID=A0A8D0DEX6_SANLU
MRQRHSTVKEDITADRHLACQPIEIERGIIAVVKSFSSNSAPIHVQKRTLGASHQIRCELDACVRNSEVMHRSGFISFDYAHLQSLQYCPPPISPQIELREDVLRGIVSGRWFSEERKRACLLKKAAANAEGIPFSVEVEVESSSSRRYVSVYEANLSYYKRFGRLMVMFDTANNTWHCHCVKAKQACVHKAIAKWHFFQTRKELFTGDEHEDTQESQGSEDKVETVTSSNLQYPPRDQDLERIVRYIHNKKRLPADLPEKVYGLTSETEVPKHLIPKECVCPECPGDLPLGEPLIISRSAKIITVKGIIEGVTTYGKKCSRCVMMVRYQEWEDGLHNFNDKVILTLHFCLYLRNCLQTHTALGRAIETWELTSGQQYPNKNSLIHGYLHFEALTDHDYNFSCVCCEHHPPVVVMDLHKSCVFSLAVNFEPSMQTIFLSVDQQNPFAVKPSYHHWAPWIGPHTRKSNKVHPKEQTEIDITEDRLLDEVSNLKVHAIRKICRECRIDSQGDWAVVMCPCGQVVSLKFNIRAESPRDFTDLLLSWKHMPNICIYDFARGLAVHANLIEPETMPFSPHEGRLLDPSHENLQKTVPEPGGHPLTGSADHYCLYDTFHEGNTKDPKDILRRIKMVPELAGRINSQVAEQLFSTMKKNNYYMNMLSPSAHVFLMRNVIHNYNQRKNKKIKEELKKLLTPEIPLCLNEHGQAEFCASQPAEVRPDPVVTTSSQPAEVRPDPVVTTSSQPAEMDVLCICFQIKGIATVAVDAYVVVTWLPPYEASPVAKIIVSSNVTELVPQVQFPL